MLTCQLLPSAPILKVDKTKDQTNDKSTYRYKNDKFKKYTPKLRCQLKLSTKNKMSLKSKMPNLNHDYNITKVANVSFRIGHKSYQNVGK